MSETVTRKRKKGNVITLVAAKNEMKKDLTEMTKELHQKAKSGEMISLVSVYVDKEGLVWWQGSYRDRYKMIGGLEHLKAAMMFEND